MKTITSESVEDYLKRCGQIQGCDTKELRKVIAATLKYYAGDETHREATRASQELEASWYASIESGSPNFAVYDSQLYLAEVWACWSIYSKKYITALAKLGADGGPSILERIGNPNVVMDLGCGSAYTTAYLFETLPNARVCGTNVETTMQFKIASQLASERGFILRGSIAEAAQIEFEGGLVFASEYFEHFERPVEHLRDVLETIKPDSMIIANAFNAKATGHFPFYFDGDRKMTGPETSKLFNNTLREAGFKKLETKLWNNRPTVWTKIA